MPIQPPSLDDRRFDDLVEELLARIPAHTPEWTNPRLGDPGRTLIELFAWLTDTLLYRANLVPERQRLVFLSLLGKKLAPALPATGIVSLSYAQERELAVTSIAAGARLAGPVPFETLSETTILPLTAEAYYKRALGDAETQRMAEVIEGLKAVHRVAGAAKAYETTPLFDGGRAEPGGVDVLALSADRALWLALLAPPAAQPQQQETLNATVRQALGGGDSGAPALVSIGVVPAIALPEGFDDFIDAANPRVPVPVLWEITTRGRSANLTDYLTLVPQADATAGLTRAGTLRLGLPDESQIWAPSNDVEQNPAAGVGDAPPRLDDPAKAARLIAWLRLRPQPDKAVEHLALSWLGINAVAIDQRITLAGRVLGVSNGAADQSLQLPLPSCEADSLRIEVEDPGLGYRPWQRVDDLAAISPDPQVAREAAAFELDAEAGVLRFGDGVRGRVPEPQMRIRLAHGRFGGGTAGNLPAGSLGAITATRVDRQAPPPLKVAQPLPTLGGVDAESLTLAERRIPAFLRHRDRAVTPEDYRQLALETPATAVGRVEVLPRFKPRDRRFDVAGVVSVMALPAQDFDPSVNIGRNPRPDRPFIERVHGWLAARVPLATELYVIGCEYVALGLSVGVSLRDGYDRDGVLFEVRRALRRLLWPLPPGGAAGSGWPLGGTVKERELEVEISRVAGVREVTGIRLFERARFDYGDDWRALPRNTPDGTQILTLREWQLPELLSVVAVDGPAAPDNLRALPNPFANADAVAVPVVPEIC
ncbi:putative baseplate assembly protein [Methylococcus sp. EFPC2]|uniref:putative baseplate assembly protein n=1 Tax=Methylococcus sp. EFPC2 TaxID=2812648 RepID=UPI00196731BD|nr:putative baseplate assembly protein [Methylococcus sp. EFPC2]QSA98400.1 putative baseplate assembly protein [Methylococcus sp. EFPC2]